MSETNDDDFEGAPMDKNISCSCGSDEPKTVIFALRGNQMSGRYRMKQALYLQIMVEEIMRVQPELRQILAVS